MATTESAISPSSSTWLASNIRPTGCRSSDSGKRHNQSILQRGARGAGSSSGREPKGIALGFSIRCDGESWQGLAERLSAVVADLSSATDMASLARAIVPLVSHLELRMPSAPAHREAVTSAQTSLRDLPLHRQVADAIGAERAEAVTLLMLAIDDILTPPQRAALNELTQPIAAHPALASELSNVRAQLAALWTLERPQRLGFLTKAVE
jgi:hypothetical protein